jgi:hypothetical protein
MKRAYSALMAVIIMGVVMLIVAVTLVTLGGDSNQLAGVISNRYYAKNLAKSCAEKGVTYLRNKASMDANESYKARMIIEASDDTMLSSANPSFNYGAAPAIALYAGSALLYRFNVAGSLPVGASIEAATMKIYSLSEQNSSATIRAYKILPANGAWLEGNNNGTPSSFFDPNWSYLDYGSLTNWAGSLGMSTAGTDYYNIPEVSIADTLTSSTAYSLEISSSTANSWLTAANNQGLVLRSDSNNWLWFATKEATSTNQHPVLDVIYNATKLLSVGGGIKQDYGYCFYETVNTSGENWQIKSTGISKDAWAFNLVDLWQSTSSPSSIAINGWKEVSGF